MIEAIDLNKSFGAVHAVRGVSFKVDKGEAVGFLGPNGAGKTTTFRMLAGTIGPSSGEVRLLGKLLAEDPIGAKRCLGYMAENAPLYPELTGEEYLAYRAELKGLPRAERRRALRRAAELSRSEEMLGTPIAHLSKGYRQRMALADALLGDPPILLLDEPTSGLDPNQVLEIRKLIVELAKDHAVILSTHVLSEVEATCSRAIVIHDGRIVGEGTLAELERRRAGGRQRIVARATPKLVQAVLEETEARDASVTERSDSIVIAEFLPPNGELAPIIERCVKEKIEILEAAPIRAALDDVFAQLTRDRGQK